MLCRFIISSLLMLSGCTNLDKPRTPQQKGLDPGAFEVLSSPVNDADLDSLDIDIIGALDDDSDNELAIDEIFYKSISISASEKMRMREVLTKMAELAGINIFIAQDIEGNISFTAKNRPFLDILKDICSSAGLKYEISGNSVKVEYDSPMLKFYKIPSLNIQRDTQSSVNISTDVFNENILSTDAEASSSGSNLNVNNGSNSVISGSAKNDFWTELELSLKTILGESDGNYVSIHKQCGLITAYTTQSKHKEIQRYIKLLKEASESQVLIEAKIIEVNLNDEFKSGINWDITKFSGGIKRTYDTAGLFTATLRGTSENEANKKWSIVSGFIEKFGAVKTLSSPRITILNNHSAVLKVAKNEIVYLPSFQKQYNGRDSNNITDMLSTNMKSIPIGLIMTVQPSIDTKNNTVLLTIRPTVSRIVGSKDIPFLFNNYIQTDGNNSQNKSASPQIQKVPVVDVRELDSVLKLKSGQIVVMGGLMSEQSHNNRDGLPGFHKTPIDILTSERDKKTEVTELVIFLRATILNRKKKAYHNADEKIYNTFASDPRKLKFKK